MKLASSSRTSRVRCTPVPSASPQQPAIISWSGSSIAGRRICNHNTPNESIYPQQTPNTKTTLHAGFMWGVAVLGYNIGFKTSGKGLI